MNKDRIKLYMKLRGWDANTLGYLLNVTQEQVERWAQGTEECPYAYGLLIVLAGEEIITSEDLALADAVIKDAEDQ
jgi:hypothetical protein